MATKEFPKAQNPLLLRFHRLMDAFAKSDDERDFYLDKVEGFIFYIDLDKTEEEIAALDKEVEESRPRYCLIPKMTFYETKKFMEGFVNEKVYDIDTKEKLLEIIQSDNSRENFLEFIYDHLTELEKWQQYYHERSRIRIIEWLRQQEIQFVFEEDLDFNKNMLEKIKRHLFDAKVPKDVANARDALEAKAKTYYSSEALNPRPKRGRPPKQAAKVEVETQVTVDMYLKVPPAVRLFLYLPDISNPSAVTFSSRFDTEADLLASLRGGSREHVDTKLEALSQRLESLQNLSSKLSKIEDVKGIIKNEPMLKDLKSKVEEGKPKGRIMGVVKGFLPKRKDSDEDASSEISKGKRSGVKRVSQIKKKKKEDS